MSNATDPAAARLMTSDGVGSLAFWLRAKKVEVVMMTVSPLGRLAVGMMAAFAGISRPMWMENSQAWIAGSCSYRK